MSAFGQTIEDVRALLAGAGASKHGDAWKEREPGEDLAAIGRHVDAYLRGEVVDHETGYHPLVHVAARAVIIVARDRRRDFGY